MDRIVFSQTYVFLKKENNDMMECSSHSTNYNYLWSKTEEYLFYHKLFNAESLSVLCAHIHYSSSSPFFFQMTRGFHLEFLLQECFIFYASSQSLSNMPMDVLILSLFSSPLYQWRQFFFSSRAFFSYFLFTNINIQKIKNERGMLKNVEKKNHTPASETFFLPFSSFHIKWIKNHSTIAADFFFLF